jgi:hypothetical protein
LAGAALAGAALAGDDEVVVTANEVETRSSTRALSRLS